MAAYHPEDRQQNYESGPETYCISLPFSLTKQHEVKDHETLPYGVAVPNHHVGEVDRVQPPRSELQKSIFCLKHIRHAILIRRIGQ